MNKVETQHSFGDVFFATLTVSQSFCTCYFFSLVVVSGGRLYSFLLVVFSLRDRVWLCFSQSDSTPGYILCIYIFFDMQ